MKKLHSRLADFKPANTRSNAGEWSEMKRIDSPGSQGRIGAKLFQSPRAQRIPETPPFMHSLYYALTDQHREEFAPVRCDEQTVSRLVRYFEDVVTENKLSAVVIEGRCLSGEPERQKKRLGTLAAASRRVYLFSCDSECSGRAWQPEEGLKLTALEERDHHGIETGPFILVMEPRF